MLVHTGPTDEKGMPQDRAFINGGLMTRDPEGNVIGVIKPVMPLASQRARELTAAARVSLVRESAAGVTDRRLYFGGCAEVDELRPSNIAS